jgi:hypothetical protein
LQTQKGIKLKRLRSEHGREFNNKLFEDFCVENGIYRKFQHKKHKQNSVVERKNRAIKEMARVMLNAKKISHR